jgi:hypothetical protein
MDSNQIMNPFLLEKSENETVSSVPITILGCSKLGHLSFKATTKLLDGIQELDINVIDTAPTYPGSHARIGDYFKSGSQSTLRVMTKFGRGNMDLTPVLLKDSLYSSLKDLNKEQIFGLSIHNRPSESISQEVIQTSTRLKQDGYLKYFGWCGAWENLPLDKIDSFDFLMLPINPFIVNPPLSKIIGQIPIIAMNPFANFFWQFKKPNYVMQKMNEKIRKRYTVFPEIYKNIIIDPPGPNVESLIKYLVNQEYLSAFCFGSTKIDHIKEVINTKDFVIGGMNYPKI